jgi:hypothetical protein
VTRWSLDINAAPPPDTTPPVVSNVVHSTPDTSDATITWSTNEVSNTQVEYGFTASYGSSTTLNSAMVTSHSATLSGLSAGTTYSYRVRSRDAAGNLGTAAGNFQTPAPAGSASGATTTEDFNDNGPAVNSNLNNMFWNIQWGTSAWYYSGPQRGFNGNNIGFRDAATSSGTFILPGGTHLVSIRANNPNDSENTVAATVTVSCSGQPTVSQSVPLNATVTLTTNWSAPCNVVTVTTSNNWHTNFDDLVYE